jgi:hypothetical protein
LAGTSFGSFPIKEAGTSTDWPKCSNCNTDLQYLGKIETDIGIEMIFMCNSDPGMCDEWDADAGGNTVIVVSGDNMEIFKPVSEMSLRDTEYGARIVEAEGENYDEEREKWQGSQRDVLGKLFGEPDWIQGDETPDCDCCNKPMRFVAQLEEGPDYKTAMNFGGGGMAYLFDCTTGKTAKFLWQC